MQSILDKSMYTVKNVEKNHRLWFHMKNVVKGLYLSPMTIEKKKKELFKLILHEHFQLTLTCWKKTTEST